MTERLKRRRDFLAAAKGLRVSRRAFSLECRRRDDAAGPRVGFTVTKKTAVKAVERNRIRRRLKEAVRLLDPSLPQPGTDYVLVGRRAALSQSFADIQAELASGLAKCAERGAQPDGRSRTR